LVAVLSQGSVIAPVGAAPAERQDARKHYDEATSAFGLGRYADAAAEYEAAFRLRPDPALLYNCAQSYRLAGNNARALELYRNYVRLYGDAPNAGDARKHVNDLESQIASDKAAAANDAPAPALAPRSPSVSPANPFGPTSSLGPGDVPAAAAVASPPPMPTPTPNPTIVSSPSAPGGALDLASASPPSQGQADAIPRSTAYRPWLWVAIGTAVIASTVIVLLSTRSDTDPNATLGRVSGN
jgi:tetratricopeptide (TPR) repeat protein